MLYMRTGLHVDDFIQNFWQRNFYKVGDKVTLKAMPIADAHHPQISDAWEILMNNVRILVGLLLARYEALSRLDGVCHHWTLAPLRRFRQLRHSIFALVQGRYTVLSWCSKRRLLESLQILVQSKCELGASRTVLVFFRLFAFTFSGKDTVQVFAHRKHVSFVGKVEFMTIPYLSQNIRRMGAHCSNIGSIIMVLKFVLVMIATIYVIFFYSNCGFLLMTMIPTLIIRHLVTFNQRLHSLVIT